MVIVGGGANGLSLAYHLARGGMRDVVLLERNSLTSGTSWHAAGIVGPLRATPNMTRLAMEALTLFPALEDETGMATGYRRTGGYWLARAPARMDELCRIAALGQTVGLSPEIADPAAVDVPGLDLRDHVGALAVPEDGNVNPVDLCMAYARAAKARGVDIREGAHVTRIETQARRVTGVRLADGSVIAAPQVALCAGAWSKPLASHAGLALPLQAVEHMYVVTEPMPNLPDPFPVLRDLDTGIYVKGDAGKLVIGGFEPQAKCWDAFGPEGDRPFLELAEDWDQFGPFMQAALDLMPRLEQVGIQHFMNGPESFTHDTRPLIGPAPEVAGLFVAAGMNSVGVMSSAGIGRLLAGWMTEGAPEWDAWEVDVARVDPQAADAAHMAARMEEAVADLFALHWPYKQPEAGRGLRCSGLHDRWAAQGAVFGQTAGWERGLWYAQTEAERDLPYSVGAQPWWEIAAREAAEMAEGAVLLDLSPFTKVEITGPDVLGFLNMHAAAQMDVPVGKAVYTPILNDGGGIEADVTITRRAADRFWLVSGAATRWRDMALLRARAVGWEVQIADQTETEVVIGVMGAGSRSLLTHVSDADWQGFGFGTAREVLVSGAPCLATRLSFVGELGWELSIPSGKAGQVFDALIVAGAKPMGHYALDGCRIEKGFKHWGHDIGPDVTPLEAGLGFTIDWSKDFIGKAALEMQKAEGVKRRLCLFQVEGKPLLLHDEPIWCEGRVVGLTSSGARGPRTGLDLCFGLIEAAVDGPVEIEVAGQRYPAKRLKRSPFDPDGTRMRA
ncbi:GcvT family protein [Roseovarius rhodophyticola]|uniref:FAD-dependent oxidoreductase n=1 Tax=Roseovarius rhodophyticola TaxID=3080827 RepID=A0ABZ2TJV9_9RHOB|nr:FAD-dependent oxidoreductase [Roseovarius sp. W115]MDV2929779.1 FAD-dependent oxidoreductase [Roseovarius sp. W115]